MKKNREQVMENKRLPFTRSKNAGVRLLFSVLALSLPANAQLIEGRFTYRLIESSEASEITAYSGSSANLIIPDTLGGKPVKSIGESVFYRKTTLQSVSFPSSLTSIKDAAFYDCTELRQLTLPNSLAEIGEEAFRNCHDLTELTLPNSLTSIGHSAFYECSGLTEIRLPNSLPEIRGSTFFGCSGLTQLTLPNSVTNIGLRAFRSCSGLRQLMLSASLNAIGEEAFYNCSKLTQLTLPDSLTEIGAGAFSRCIKLTQAALPASVTSIGAGIFEGCTDLAQIEVHSSSLHFSSRDGVLFNKQKTVLWQYPAGKSGPYTLPSSVTSIGERSFVRCSDLTELTLPNSLTSIGHSAFSECSGLTELILPDSLTAIGQEAFHRCSNLRIALFEGDAPSTVGSRIFDRTASEFKVQFYENAGGFTAPAWEGYASESIPRPSVFSTWLNSFEFTSNDLAANGEPLLIAYALNLNPTNSAARLPIPVMEGGKIRLHFPIMAERSDVLLKVESAADLLSGIWEAVGVETNSGMGSVSIPFSGSESPEKLYLRFTARQAE